MNDYTKKVIKIIKSIPSGKTMSYGDIAKTAGKNRGAREVSRILHSCSEKYGLPWHRVINSQGKISLSGEAGQFQREMLEQEGIRFDKNGKINEVYINKGRDSNDNKERRKKRPWWYSACINGDYESKLTDNIRKGKKFILFLIAENNGKIIRHIMYSRIKTGDSNYLL